MKTLLKNFWIIVLGIFGFGAFAFAVTQTIDPANVAITGGSITGITDITVVDGGSGASTLLDHGVLVGSGTAAITPLAVGTNGQLLVGSSAADPVFATLNCDAGLTCTTGAGTLEIDADSATTAKSMTVAITALDTAVATGSSTAMMLIPTSLNGMDVKEARCTVYDQGVTGSTDVGLIRRRSGTAVDVLSTLITIGAEYAASDGVINTSNDDLSTNDQLYWYVNAVHSGTAPNGLSCTLTANIP